jgi:hypothetical protein
MLLLFGSVQGPFSNCNYIHGDTLQLGSKPHLQFGEIAEALRQVRQAVARQIQFPQCLQLAKTAGKFCQTWAVLEFSQPKLRWGGCGFQKQGSWTKVYIIRICMDLHLKHSKTLKHNHQSF